MQTLQLPDTTLRDYQNAFLGDAIQRADDANPGDAFLYAAPTGAGKSVMELALLGYLPGAILVTPRLEIVAGMLQKGGIDTSSWSDDKLAREALAYRITTPVRLRNMLAKGTLPWRPDALIVDEAHHWSADTYQDLAAYLGGGILRYGLTASPFRGTPQGTAEFQSQWNDTTWVLTYPQAAARGVIAVPRCTIWPLVDDDEIEVTAGEIVVRSAEDATRPVLDEIVNRCRVFASPSGWDQPTMFAVPTTGLAHDLADRLSAAGCPAAAVTQDTPRPDRNWLFAECVAGRVAIVQIDVVSEGVDLPLRRLIDLRPTMSPVKWLQQVGRITRPVSQACVACLAPVTGLRCGECGTDAAGAPEYICCNRNLERHCYLYEGLIPPSKVAEAQRAFGRPSRRAGARAVGLEGLGRFTAAELPLAGGLTGTMYQLTCVDDYTRRDYAVLVHPCSADPLYAVRDSRGADGSRDWGKWRATAGLPDLRGFGSAPAKSVSEKQRAWWTRAAASHGLDPLAPVNARNFAALPVLRDLGIRLQSVGGAA